LIRQQK